MPPVRRRRYSTGTIQELAEPLLRAAPASLAATALPRDCEAREGRRHSWGSSSGLESVVGDFQREGSVASDSTLSPVVRKDLRKQAKAKRKALFPDPEKVKEEVRSAVCDVYDVETLYTRDGFWQALARSNVFKNVTFLVIALNSLWIAIDTDFNRSDALSQSPWEFQATENLFCAFFSFEIFVRFKAFRRKRDAFGDFWFVFDGSLASVMATCTWIEPLLFYFKVLATADPSAVMQNASMFRLLRLFRLSRVARLARLLKDVPELMVLIKGMASATRAVFSTLCLLVLVIYVFAIVFTQTMTGTQAAEGCFENVLQSMNCLLLNGVFADQAALISKLLDEHWTYYVTILVYMVIGSLTVLNMLIGVMCEVVQVVSEAEKDVIRTQNLKEKIGKILSFADKDHDKMITIEEFRLLLQSQDAMQALAEMKIHVVELVDFVDCIFDDKQALPFSAFVDTILQFRSDNTATVKDLFDTRRVLLTEVDYMLQEVAPSK